MTGKQVYKTRASQALGRPPNSDLVFSQTTQSPSMLLSLFVLWATTASASTSLLPNTDATFPSSPQPFTISVSPAFINATLSRVANSRPPTPITGLSPPNTDGPTLANYTALRNYWLNEYSWRATQEAINRDLKQFTTTVHSPDSSYPHPVPLHFVHHRSPRADAIPLLFIHGWPGSFLEVSPLITLLTNPPNASVPAFHVVAPSIPGYGFSPAPVRAGYGPLEAGRSFHALMLQLGYEKYVVQGGDIGGFILRHQAAAYPASVVSALSNFWLVRPNATDLARLEANQTTEGAAAYMQGLERYIVERSGYRFVQQTVPLALAYLANDSPLGFALWVWNLMSEIVDPRHGGFGLGEVVTWSLMYSIQGPYGGFRMYKEMVAEGDFADVGIGRPPFVTQPVGVTQRPYDLGFGMPVEWARRDGNVKAVYVHEVGGHFAAYKDTESLADDAYRWFGDRELSGTAVFYQ